MRCNASIHLRSLLNSCQDYNCEDNFSYLLYKMVVPNNSCAYMTLNDNLTTFTMPHEAMRKVLCSEIALNQESAVMYQTIQQRSLPPTDTARLPSLMTHTLVTLEQCAVPEDV